ncbi:squalene--hopene cyclase [Bacillus sp. DTU_2020_1000418_1_SI_GHA_SEK_038]|uniref:squalene--hopene cyclase n=1 Tax=Bacillus sp. DTU_2020_1000418_1_SI_GHA_SEK_038 TaxID=3077585 RepID=UPI0028E7AD07|nr:squalene--hopene cyclase [Bacillus sp. DTU_2020_1000418_1_SI_GHA_SEK_038]WNS77587.1 squalene--hopene cyclase [Bacillus sp. DTU_2020_1000418_1_SI_GHA_SEK_038]
MKNAILDGINNLIEVLRKDQNPNGSWDYPFETGISTDCYMIILLRTLEINDEKLILDLTKRILSRQEGNGAWKLFYDEGEGNLTATVEAYYALLYSGYYQKEDNRLKAAKRFTLKKGGIDKAHMFTKIMLAITGQIKWPRFFPIPLEMILLPISFPINFYSFSEYGKVNLAPIMILADRKFQLKSSSSPDLSSLFIQRGSEFESEWDEWRSIFSTIEKGIKSLIGLPSQIHKLATEQTKQFMLHRIEPDGTLYGYFSSTFLMIFALLSLGVSKKDSLITNAINGLMRMKCEIKGFPHMQYTTATVWNTSLINYALQEAGVSVKDGMVIRANHYLLKRQHYKYGDWIINNPGALPGGWGFADMNTIHPDVDDTTSSLRSIARIAMTNPSYRPPWEKGVSWVLSMQNNDGGWPAFEKNTNSKLLQLLPIEKAEFLLTDPSSADLTGRTLEFLGNYTNLPKKYSPIQRGINWLTNSQEENGSWYGRWGICYIYGTWGAITGLRAAGVFPGHRTIAKAVNWLKVVQNPDGGWGESCKSDSDKSYVPLKASTLTHTAWALDALISAYDQPTKEIESGIQFILDNLNKDDWTTDYPKGQGMAGDFYLHYHSYRYIFPLLALAHYKGKYS